MSEPPAEPRRQGFLIPIALIGAVILIFLWHRNYNLLGEFFDYSIVTAAPGHMEAGMKPYRDFTTPLQSLTIYACRAAEMVFGRRYLALAYGNLILGLGSYVCSIVILRRYLPATLTVLTTSAICLATFFQHGIIWYNPIALGLFTLTLWRCAVMYREKSASTGDIAILSLLLFLSSMAKANFHILAFGMACVITLLMWVFNGQTQRKRFFWLAGAIIFFGLLAGPIAEVLLNHTTLHEFLEDVYRTPTDRIKRLLEFADPNLYLGKMSDSYPDNWSSGIYLKAILIFCGCAYLVSFRSPADGKDAGGVLQILELRIFAPVMLAGLLVCAMLLTITNSETQMLTSSFLISGLVAVYLMYGKRFSLLQDFGFKFGIFLLSAYFFLAGSASAFMHSRVRLGEPSWTKMMLEAMYKQKHLSALKNAVPFYPAASISSDLEPYFSGVRFTELGRVRLTKVISFMEKNHLKDRTQKIYWGPGLEIMNRVYGESAQGRFPLWYHHRVTVNDRDSDRIIGELKRHDYEWIIATGWISEMPAPVLEFINGHFEKLEDDEVVIYQRVADGGAAKESSAKDH